MQARHELDGRLRIGQQFGAALAARHVRVHLGPLGLAERARFVRADWGDGIVGCFDLIVANPPYVPVGEIALLAPEVSLHEPRAALDGGSDGLDAYRALLPHLGRLLAPAGTAVLEVGSQQADGVSAILDGGALAVRSYTYDLGGRVRCLAARRP